MTNKESYLQTKIIKYLESLGWYVIKLASSTKAGRPDLICCDTNGMFWGFEVKTEDGVLSKLQAYNINLIVKTGGKAFVVYNLDDVKIAIQKS